MKKPIITNLVVALFAISPLLYLSSVWQSIPESFVTRFKFDSTFERVQSREALVIASIILSVASILVYMLMRNIETVDPKVSPQTPKSAFNKLGAMLLVFMTCWNFLFIVTVQKDLDINVNITFAAVGLLITLLGNYMHNIKPNYFAGIRLPWTLNDPENWRRTHHLASKLWFSGGIVLIIFSFAIPETLFMPLFIAVVVVLVAVPGVYSFRIYKKSANA